MRINGLMPTTHNISEGSSLIDVVPGHSSRDSERMYPHWREGTSWPRGLGTGKSISRDVSGRSQQWIRIGSAKVTGDPPTAFAL